MTNGGEPQGSREEVTRGLLVAAIVFVAINVWAGDPWEKSYKDWDEDEKDVRRILNDSPWSKAVEIERKEQKHGLEAPAGAPTVAGAREEDEEDEGEEKTMTAEEARKRRKRTTSNFWFVGYRPELSVRPQSAARCCKERFPKRRRTNTCLQRPKITN